MEIYDTHAHLDQLEDLPGALSRAAESGVKGIVAISMDLQSCRRLIEIHRVGAQHAVHLHATYPKIYIALGMHPSEAKPEDLDQVVATIRQLTGELVAVGEIGLDFWYKWVRKDDVKKNEQRLVFRMLLALAKELDLPAVIHSRGCWRECYETCRELGVNKALFHWYSGPLDVLDDILAAGYYVSTSPSVAGSPQSREAMTRAPIERTLIETDCPVYYGDPKAGSGFKAEPKDVWRTLAAYAALKNLSEQDALTIVNRNAEEFFGLPATS